MGSTQSVEVDPYINKHQVLDLCTYIRYNLPNWYSKSKKVHISVEGIFLSFGVGTSFQNGPYVASVIKIHNTTVYFKIKKQRVIFGRSYIRI